MTNTTEDIKPEDLNKVELINQYFNSRKEMLKGEVPFYLSAYKVMGEAMKKAKVTVFNKKAQEYLKKQYGVELFDGFPEDIRRQHVSYANFVGKNPKECEKVAKETGKAISGVVGAVKKKDKKEPAEKVENKKPSKVLTEKDMVSQLIEMRIFCKLNKWDFEKLVKLSSEDIKESLTALIKEDKVAA
jgi:hypothetical protein